MPEYNTKFLSLLTDLIHQTNDTLNSIKQYTQLSRGKFSDKEFGEFFCRMVTNDIKKNAFVLDGFLNYINVNTFIRKKGTVNILVEEVLKRHQVQFEENKTKIFRNFEKDLPETVVSDEQLRFILDSILQYAVGSMPPNGNIELLTKSFAISKEMEEDQEVLKKETGYIKILVAFTLYKEPMEEMGKGLEAPVPSKQVALDLLLRLVDDVVEGNQGTMKFGFDETKAKTIISLKFPTERRKVVLYT